MAERGKQPRPAASTQLVTFLRFKTGFYCEHSWSLRLRWNNSLCKVLLFPPWSNQHPPLIHSKAPTSLLPTEPDKVGSGESTAPSGQTTTYYSLNGRFESVSAGGGQTWMGKGRGQGEREGQSLGGRQRMKEHKHRTGVGCEPCLCH